MSIEVASPFSLMSSLLLEMEMPACEVLNPPIMWIARRGGDVLNVCGGLVEVKGVRAASRVSTVKPLREFLLGYFVCSSFFLQCLLASPSGGKNSMMCRIISLSVPHRRTCTNRAARKSHREGFRGSTNWYMSDREIVTG